MSAIATEETIHTINIVKEVRIAAPIEVAFEAVLDELGPGGQMPDGRSLAMKIEPRPGGRWYRDLGNDAGHLWGHVQVIKPPTLLEICGPLFMSYPVANFVQYRLSADGDGTLLKLTHQAFGQIPAADREGVKQGWDYSLKRIGEIAARLAAARGRKG